MHLTTCSKGKVECGVGHAQKTPLKGQHFESLEQAQAYLDRWEERWADTRIHGTTKRQSPRCSPKRNRRRCLCPSSRFAITATASGPCTWMAASKSTETGCPADLDVHIILDNDSTHQSALVKTWRKPKKQRRFDFHFTLPPSSGVGTSHLPGLPPGTTRGPPPMSSSIRSAAAGKPPPNLRWDRRLADLPPYSPRRSLQNRSFDLRSGTAAHRAGGRRCADAWIAAV
jgi:hypothetical protein